METSIFSAVHGPLAWGSLGCAAIAAVLLLYYLIRRPPLHSGTKMLLLLGIGVFPVASALSGNIVGFQTTSERKFCGGCHVMTPYTDDAGDPKSASLAAVHGRNAEFGHRNCYTCHADYGMFGTVATKMAGMRHVYEYFLNGYKDMTLEEARDKIHILKPFPNSTCMHCHSTTLPGWKDEPEHLAIYDDVASGKVSCASAGCHGPAHPFSKTKAQGGTR